MENGMEFIGGVWSIRLSQTLSETVKISNSRFPRIKLHNCSSDFMCHMARAILHGARLDQPGGEGAIIFPQAAMPLT
jgi:hypothetical protein